MLLVMPVEGNNYTAKWITCQSQEEEWSYKSVKHHLIRHRVDVSTNISTYIFLLQEFSASDDECEDRRFEKKVEQIDCNHI